MGKWINWITIITKQILQNTQKMRTLLGLNQGVEIIIVTNINIIIIIIINVHLETLYIVQLYHSVYKK